MAPTTDIHEQTPSATAAAKSASGFRRIASKLWAVIKASIFWSYERGSWQYDIIVVAILAFIFLSPRSWFNDRPTLQLTNLRHQQGIVLMTRVNKEAQYLVDKRLVDTYAAKPEEAIADILKEHLQKPFKLKSIAAVRDRHQVILGYTVVVEQ